MSVEERPDWPSRDDPVLRIEFCGEWTEISPYASFGIGRDADLVLDDNPYLHRRFLEIVYDRGVWWLKNVGTYLAATLSDETRRAESWLGPGSHLPIVFADMRVRFMAGSTRYEMGLHLSQPPFEASATVDSLEGETTIGRVSFTRDQWLCILALAEPMLTGAGQSIITLPSNVEAARRLGWTITRFNRKLDNVCGKLTKVGVHGLHGGAGDLASDRRARLVEYAMAVGIVSRKDVGELDTLMPEEEDGE